MLWKTALPLSIIVTLGFAEINVFPGSESNVPHRHVEKISCQPHLRSWSAHYLLHGGSELHLTYSKRACLCTKVFRYIFTTPPTRSGALQTKLCFNYVDLLHGEKLVLKLTEKGRKRNVAIIESGRRQRFCYEAPLSYGHFQLELRLKVKRRCPTTTGGNAAAGYRIVINTVKASCRHPGELQNGHLLLKGSLTNASSFPVGSQVFFLCNSSFQHVGTKTAHCLPNRSWSHPLPRCTTANDICPPVDFHLPNGTVDVPFARSVGSIARLRCNPGFGLRGLPSYRCLHSGQWERSDKIVNAQCIEGLQTCPDLLSVEHTTIVSLHSSFEVGAYFFHCCAPGAQALPPRRLAGSGTLPKDSASNCSRRWCSIDGVWTGRPPRCEIAPRLFQRLYTDLLSSAAEVRHHPSSEGEELTCLRVPVESFTNTSSSSGEAMQPSINASTLPPLTSSFSSRALLNHSQPNQQLEYMPGCSREGRIISDTSGCFDLAFLLDGSGSISSVHFETLVLRFVRNVTNFFTIAEDKARITVLVFTHTTKWILKNAHNPRHVYRTLTNLSQPLNGDTNLRRAMINFLEMVALPLHNGSFTERKSCRKAMFVVTDGDVNKGGSPAAVASILKEQLFWEIYAIGIANAHLQKDNLNVIASLLHKEHIFIIETEEESSKEPIFPIQIPKADFTRCGRPSGALDVNRRARILGGARARFGRYPWQVAIIHRPTETVLCGGSLICLGGCRWVLTAAHCIWSISALRGNIHISEGDLKLRFGETDLTVQEGSELECGVHKYFLPRLYNPRTFEDDIALLEPDCQVPLSSQRRCICLPEAEDAELADPGNGVEVAGWGVIGVKNGGRIRSPTLKWARLEVISHSECNRNKHAQVDEGMLCAGTVDGHRDSCEGDSGGPLMARRNDDSYTVLGVLSHAQVDRTAPDELQCGRRGYYGVYTSVLHKLPWITQVLREQPCHGT